MRWSEIVAEEMCVLALVALLILALLGCSRSPGRPLTQVEQDQIRCAGVARRICPSSIYGCKTPAYRECMALLGWRFKAGKYTKEGDR